MTTDALPVDWNEWRTLWREWAAAHSDTLRPTRRRFNGKNFLADEILGTWNVGGQVVELSEMTFPNLTERDERGLLIRKTVRGIGITRENGGTVVPTFADLERELGIKEAGRV